MKEQVLFITDGSMSAQNAGQFAMELALLWKAPLRSLFILDESWGDILGDEWMNSSATRMHFFSWLSKNLIKQAEMELLRFCRQAENNRLKAATEIKIGNTEQVIIEAANSTPTTLLVLPNPYSTKPLAEAGLKVKPNNLIKRVNCPIFLGPRL